VATPEHTGFVSDEEDKEIDTGLGLQMISLRLSKSLIEQFKELAKLEQIGYQPLMRQVLTVYAKQNEHKLVELLTPTAATEWGDLLFMQALSFLSFLKAVRLVIPSLRIVSSRVHMSPRDTAKRSAHRLAKTRSFEFIC
jgi:hypothetical protein